jgi:hypothetical protein
MFVYDADRRCDRGSADLERLGSPDYLAAHGKPAKPQDSVGHQGIRMLNIAWSENFMLKGPDDERHAAGRFSRRQIERFPEFEKK